MLRNKPVQIITALLFYLTCFHYVLQAQEDAAWRAISISMSNNGRYLAVKYGENIPGHREFHHGIWIYDLEDLLLPPQYLGEMLDPEARMVFSPDSRYVALGGYYRLLVFNADSKVTVLGLPNSVTALRTDFKWITFSPDSNYIMSYSDWWTYDHEMSIWNVHTGQRVHAVAALRSQQWVQRPWLSPDWTQFVDWSRHELAVIYEFDIEQGLGQLLVGISVVDAGAAFSPDGSLFAFATWEGEVQVYETYTWTLKNKIQHHKTPCGDLGVRFGFSHSKPLLAASCRPDKAVSVWNFETNEVIFLAETFSADPVFTLDDEHLIASTIGLSPENSSIHVWNVPRDFELTIYPGKDPKLHPNSELMATIAPDGRVSIWNIKSKQLLVTLPVPRH